MKPPETDRWTDRQPGKEEGQACHLRPPPWHLFLGAAPFLQGELVIYLL